MALRNAQDYLEAEHPHLFNGCNPKVVTPFQLPMAVAGTYYLFTDATWTASLQAGFTVAANGIVTYTGVGQVLIFVGLAYLSVQTAATVTFALFVNGVPIIETKGFFDSQNKTGLVADVDFITLVTDDVIDVRVKSDAPNQVMDITELKTIYK